MLDKNIIEGIKSISDTLREDLKKLDSISREKLRSDIQNEVGELIKTDELSDDELEDIKMKGGVVAIDGSLNKIGGNSPHYIDIMSALAIFSYKTQRRTVSSIYCPLTDENYSENKEKDAAIELARLEAKLAIEVLKYEKPYIIMMDGGLLRYSIGAAQEFEEIRKLALEKNIIIIGVIEDIKTRIVGSKLGLSFFDKELLYGTLNKKESLILYEELSVKENKNVMEAFIRASKSPFVTGIDILKEQKEKIKSVLRLVLSLTPSSSRGIPILIDMVDYEVKIKDRDTKEIYGDTVSDDIRKKFFTVMRDLR